MRLTSENILENLAESSLYGNLGVFAGAGVSKAIMDDGFETIALSWGELLEKASSKFDIDFNSEICSLGFSYPELATKLCQKIATNEDIEYTTAVSKLKDKLAQITSWYPSQAKREEYFMLLDALDPSWIITTNYDLILETVFTGKSFSLGPDNQLSAPKGFIPIYHLHGTRSNPDSIIITQEDYVRLFRPNEYRHSKLPLIIKESSTLILGYGLGDINVLTALDWSENVYQNIGSNHPNFLVQVLRKNSPKKNPYIDSNGITIIETNEISTFLKELRDKIEEKREVEAEKAKKLRKLEEKIRNPSQKEIERFIQDEEQRFKIIKVLESYKDFLISGFLEFLTKVIDELWRRAEKYGAFDAYAQHVDIFSDILIHSAGNSLPPALIEMLAYNLNSVGNYIGKARGESHKAHEKWEIVKVRIPESTVRELRNIADSHSFLQLKRLLRGL